MPFPPLINITTKRCKTLQGSEELGKTPPEISKSPLLHLSSLLQKIHISPLNQGFQKWQNSPPPHSKGGRRNYAKHFRHISASGASWETNEPIVLITITIQIDVWYPRQCQVIQIIIIVIRCKGNINYSARFRLIFINYPVWIRFRFFQFFRIWFFWLTRLTIIWDVDHGLFCLRSTLALYRVHKEEEKSEEVDFTG